MTEKKDRENNGMLFYVEVPVDGKLVALRFKEKVIVCADLSRCSRDCTTLALCKTAT